MDQINSEIDKDAFMDNKNLEKSTNHLIRLDSNENENFDNFRSNSQVPNLEELNTFNFSEEADKIIENILKENKDEEKVNKLN